MARCSPHAACWRSSRPGARRARRRARCRRENAALRGFFEARFRPWRVVNPDESREGLVTGYYEPLLRGSRERSKTSPTPIYGVPDDLLVVDLGELYPELKNFRLRGRLDGRKVVPYWSRADSRRRRRARRQGAALGRRSDRSVLPAGAGLGSRRAADGRRVRVGYADQNGHPYRRSAAGWWRRAS
jgi:membrane-bound lytic murein transglycosylase A